MPLVNSPLLLAASSGAVSGQLWAFGSGGNGISGLGNTTNYSSPKQVGALATWTAVTGAGNGGGVQFCIAVRSDGTLWSWGYNGTGSLGLGNTTTYSSPKQIGALTTWNTVSAGSAGGAFALKTDGTLWAWGQGLHGALGLGNTTSYSSPKQVGALTTWAMVSAGSQHTAAVRTDGTLWVWGRNNHGQLGLNNLTDYSSPKQLGALTTWAKVFAFESWTAAIKTDGTLWTWGNNGAGRLGIGNTFGYSSPKQVGALTNWSLVTACDQSTLALKTDGTLWAWGGGGYGRLGLGNTTSYSSPVQVGTRTNWTGVAGGRFFVVATRSNGSLMAWGDNGSGQLGIGNTTNYSSPKQVGPSLGWIAIAAGKRQNENAANSLKQSSEPASASGLFAWGQGDNAARLGIGYVGNQSSPVQVASGSWISGGGAGGNAQVIKSDGTLWTWGFDSYGVSGMGTANVPRSSPVQVGALTNWAKVRVGSTAFAVALKTDGTIWAWGRNNYGQLGLGNTTDYSSPKQIGALTTWTDISCGESFTAAIKGGELWTWGRNNNFGQLGLGNLTNYSSPKQVGALTTWSKVFCHRQAMFAIKTDGTLWGWGYNQTTGMLGLGNTTNYSSPKQIGAQTDWLMVCEGSTSNVSAIKTTGKLYSWGQNGGGQLGLGNTTLYSSPKQVGALTTWTNVKGFSGSILALRSDGTLWFWGYGNYGKPGNLTSNSYSSPKQVGSGTTWSGIFGGQTSSLLAVRT